MLYITIIDYINQGDDYSFIIAPPYSPPGLMIETTSQLIGLFSLNDV